HEGIDDVGLAEVGADVAELGQRHAAQAGNAGTKAEGQHVDPAGGHAHAIGHAPVLHDGAHEQTEARAVQHQPDRAHHQHR
nr:hypothetical protein [Tanacetum cinerariifolium]